MYVVTVLKPAARSSASRAAQSAGCVRWWWISAETIVKGAPSRRKALASNEKDGAAAARAPLPAHPSAAMRSHGARIVNLRV